MQAVINENIAQQAEVLDTIYNQCIEAAENIALGNKEIAESAEKVSGAAWNMFLFIMLCTFSLLLYHFIS